MSLKSRLHGMVAVAAFALLLVFPNRGVVAQDLAHVITGVVKHVDHAGKTVVVKTADGTEHTIKYGEHTAVKAGKGTKKVGADIWLGSKEGATVTVHYTGEAGKETAIAIKDPAVKTGEVLI